MSERTGLQAFHKTDSAEVTFRGRVFHTRKRRPESCVPVLQETSENVQIH